MKPDQKNRTKLTKTYDQRNVADFRNLTQSKLDTAKEMKPIETDLTKRLAK